jgi:hypothetical protein
VKAAIMQPYFLPYIGYFQLIQAVDLFIVYDNIKYTKSGWINRNRFLQNGKDALFTLPLKKDSDFLNVVERSLAVDFERKKLLDQLAAAYRRAPFFSQCMPVLSRVVLCEESNLFRYIHHSIRQVCDYLGISTRIMLSSEIGIDHGLKSQDKVLALCAAVGADSYINPIGGLELYAREDFRARGVELAFLKALPFEYAQFGQAFVPWLSIVDVMMFNPVEAVRERLASGYELL